MNIGNVYRQIIKVQDILTEWYGAIAPLFSTDDVIIECMALRGYTSQEMFNHLKSVGLFRINDINAVNLIYPMTEEEYTVTGLKKNGSYLLSGRYCIPIRTVDNKVAAIVGYFPDQRKYVTTPTVGHSKGTSLFGVEHINYFDAPYVCLCEGIFDTLSLQAYGFPALGNQGLELSKFKSEMLRRYRKIVAIPDGDKAGATVNPYKVHIGKNQRSWDIPFDNVFIDLSELYRGGTKDIDDYLNRGTFTKERLEYLDNVFRHGKYMVTLKDI